MLLLARNVCCFSGWGGGGGLRFRVWGVGFRVWEFAV